MGTVPWNSYVKPLNSPFNRLVTRVMRICIGVVKLESEGWIRSSREPGPDSTPKNSRIWIWKHHRLIFGKHSKVIKRSSYGVQNFGGVGGVTAILGGGGGRDEGAVQRDLGYAPSTHPQLPASHTE